MINSEYRCPSCRQEARHFVRAGTNGNKATIGVSHSPTCQYFAFIARIYPKLVERIEQERGAA
jgi:hypothetical protein